MDVFEATRRGEGRIHPGRVFDCAVGLYGVPDSYLAMDQREAIKAVEFSA